MRLNVITAALAAALSLSIAYSAPAAAQGGPGQKAKQAESIYGYDMMSDAERNEYRTKMRGAKTDKERQALREEHRSTMTARMKERGIEPGQMRGKGAGPGGPGDGKGKGGGPGYGPRGGGPGDGRGPGAGKGSGPGPGPGPGGAAAP